MGEANTYEIHSVSFGSEWVEIVFTEERLRSADVCDISYRLIRPELFKDLFASIHEDLEDILDQAAIHRRNPRPLMGQSELEAEPDHYQPTLPWTGSE